MTKSAQEILAEWADPETGGTMPREVREAALSVLKRVDSLCGMVDAWHSRAEAYRTANVAAETRIKELEDALRVVDEALEQNPGGVDDDADPDNTSPEDASAHLCGLIRHDIRAALRGKP